MNSSTSFNISFYFTFKHISGDTLVMLCVVFDNLSLCDSW